MCTHTHIQRERDRERDIYIERERERERERDCEVTSMCMRWYLPSLTDLFKSVSLCSSISNASFTA